MSEKIKPRVLRFEPQVTFDELYRSPLRRERRYETTGDGTTEPQVKTVYVELKQPVVKSTGIRVLDEYVDYIAAGHSDVTAFCHSHGLRRSDIDSLLFVLTGMRGIDFRQRYQLRMMDELLRYTDLTPAEVARRSGIGSVNNLYLVTKRNYKESPVEHRRKIRLKVDWPFAPICLCDCRR